MSSAVTTERVARDTLADADQVALFHRALAELCRSDVPLPRALEAVADDLGRGPLADAVRAMAADVAAGTPLPEAYAARADAMPALYRGLVEAGIASGDLPGVLDEIAAHAASKAEIAARVRRALSYPAVVATFVAAATLVLTLVVAPKLDAVHEQSVLLGYASSGSAFDWRHSVSSSWFAPLSMAGLAGLALLAAWLFAMVRRPLDGASAFSALAWRWPVLGRIRVCAQVSTFAATLSLLLRRRLPLAHALQLAAATCDESRVRARIAAMADAADDGVSLGEALAQAGVIAPSLVWIVDSAERRGEAASAMADVARIYRERLSRSVDRAMLWITPVAELVVGIVVAFVALGYLGRLAAVAEMQRMLAERK